MLLRLPPQRYAHSHFKHYYPNVKTKTKPTWFSRGGGGGGGGFNSTMESMGQKVTAAATQAASQAAAQAVANEVQNQMSNMFRRK